MPFLSPGRLLPAFAGLLLAWFAASPAAGRDNAKPGNGYEDYAVGTPATETAGPVRPGLMLVGGGEWPYDAFRWMADRMGHGHLVVLRASGKAEVQDEWYERVGGVASVRTFVFHDRRAASDPVVLEAIRKADGIFIAGGDQSNYVRFWKGTPLATALDAHVRAGKPLGGTSAGLAILGAWVYGAMDGGSITSRRALRDPLGPGVTLVDDFLHMPFLQHVVTDTHFGKRDRLGRLVAFVADARARGGEGVVGLGVDETAALCVDGDGIGRVFSRVPGGAAWLVVPTAPPTRLAPGQPLAIAGVQVTGIGTGSRIDLRTLEVTAPAFLRVADAADGRLQVRDGDTPALADDR